MSAAFQAPERPTTPARPPHSALLAPSLSLSSCVRAYITRSTLGAQLSIDQHHNHMPATPLCGLYWLLHGQARLVRRGELIVDQPLPSIAFAGPHTDPTVTVNPGPVRLFTVGLLPQALQALTGVEMAAFVNRVVPISAVLDQAWQAMAQAVQQAPDDSARVQLIEAFLEPRWSRLCPDTLPKIERFQHWVEALALRSATSGAGKSARQMERRIKQWAGLPLRELRRLGRAEESFILARAEQLSGMQPPDWASLAADGGFADQAHLCRETRRISGLSPNELRKAIEQDERFWIYRIWH